MKKKLLCIYIFLFLLIVSGTQLQFVNQTVLAQEQIVHVVASQCYLYKDASFDEKLIDNTGELIVLSHGQSLTYIQDSQENDDFYYVELVISEQSYKGYVYKFYVTFNVVDQQVYPIFNAEVVVESAMVYDLDLSETGITLNKGTELYLYEGYQKKDEYTAICFVDKNGNLGYGYLKTKELSPYGINAGVITGIVVAASCVTIILLLIFMKKTKKRKTK